MINVQISTGSGVKHVLTVDTPLRIHELRDRVVEVTSFPEEEFYLVHNGRLAYDKDICQNGYVTIVPRLLGGKGGFGSMLRAIGAQIEKTTNREACRDLSGRRLRDINEEKRLKAWIEKQGKREEEAAERKKKKLERLCAEPRHEFKDQHYERERSVLTERVGDAVEEGFKAAVTGGIKRKHEEEAKPIKKKTILDLDIDSDELDTSDDSDDDEAKQKKMKTKDEQASNDSGHSSDESGKTDKSTCNEKNEDSEASSKDEIKVDHSSNLEEEKNSSPSSETTETSASKSEENTEKSSNTVPQENN